MNNRFSHKSRIISLILLLVFSCVLMAAPALAADGTGDGSGGGKSIPLGLDSSAPADGDKDVSLSGDIKLTFNKNVIYLGIREANKTCFSLVAADGSKVPVEVIMADDQTPEGFELRREISIHPLQELQPGTAYTVKISPELQAKNGISLGHEVTVSFVTEGTGAIPVPAAPAGETVKPEESDKKAPVADKHEVTNAAPVADKHEVTNAAPAPVNSEKDAVVEEKKASGVETVPAAEDKTKPASEPQIKTEEKSGLKDNLGSETKPNRTYAIITGLVLVAGAGYLQARKRKHR